MTPDEAEEARRLLAAAQADERAAKLLAGDSAQADAVVGFHAQQAVEKAIEVVLVIAGEEIPRTHDLVFLAEMAGTAGRPLPEALGDVDGLTPWAVAGRYGTGDLDLDRSCALTVATAAVGWAESRLAASQPAVEGFDS